MPSVAGQAPGPDRAGDSDAREGPGPAPRIGRYEVLGELGQGGFGTVLLVRDPSLLVDRAMKVPNPQTLASRSAIARFVEEGQKSVRIEHPNVVRVLDADTAGPVCYTVMEYCPEGSLAGWLARRLAGRLISPGWAARLVAEIADGVQQAHSLGILHRDLKPGNVLLVRAGKDDGETSLRSVPGQRLRPGEGARRDRPDHRGRDRDRRGAGTRGYMSPEQFRGDRPVREPSDVYGLGVILFELLTRQRPYAGLEGDASVGRWLDDSPPPSLRAIRPDVPRDLETICRTCLAKAPGDRYPTAGALAADLRRFLSGDPVEGSPWWKRARAGLRRHRVGIIVGMAALILSIGLGAVVEAVQRNNAKSWLGHEQCLARHELPTLIAERDPPTRRVIGPLNEMFDRGNATQRLAAAVAWPGCDPSVRSTRVSRS